MEDVTSPFIMVLYFIWRIEEQKNHRREERERENHITNFRTENC